MIFKILSFIVIYLVVQTIYNNLKFFFINKENDEKNNNNKIIDVDFEEIE